VTAPYYADDLVTLWHGDCREILPTLSEPVGLLLTDPPYGVAERTDRASKGRGNLAGSNDFERIHGDDAPFDPAHLLGYKPAIIFGANYFADRLPRSSSWIVWDKLDGLKTDKRLIGFDDNADAELAWSNVGGPVRIAGHRWKGMLKASERADVRVHPTQKPALLMQRLIVTFALPTGVVLDPYAGSGSTLRAAKDVGRRAVGVEISERYCEVIAKRLAQDCLDFGGVA
jgi:DNA modification methylase